VVSQTIHLDSRLEHFRQKDHHLEVEPIHQIALLLEAWQPSFVQTCLLLQQLLEATELGLQTVLQLLLEAAELSLHIDRLFIAELELTSFLQTVLHPEAVAVEVQQIRIESVAVAAVIINQRARLN
jgi:hypothetical protein